MLLRYCYLYVTAILTGTLIFFGIIWLGIVPSKALFFSTLQSLGITTLIMIVLICIAKKKCKSFRFATGKDVIIISLIFFFGHYTFYGLIPFNTSRSVSVMLIGYFLNNSNRFVSKEEIEQFVRREYFIESNAVVKRLAEQTEMGNLNQKNDEYKITKKGIFIASTMGLITLMYNTDKNYALKKAQ